MRKLLSVTLVILGAGLMLGGCGSDSEPPGSLELRWTLGAGTQTCTEAGLDTVKITLEEAEGGMVGPMSASCDAGRPGPYTVAEVAPGSYTVVIDGYQGTMRLYTGHSAARYTVESGATTPTDTIVLSPVPASIHILWRFQDGRQCQFHEVSNISILAFLNDTVAEQATSPCDAGEYLLEEVGPGTYDIQVTGQSMTGEPLYRFTSSGVDIIAGSETEVDEILEDCATIPGGCV